MSSPARTSTPAAIAESSDASRQRRLSAATSHGSLRPGTTATASTTARVAGSSLAARERTASRTVVGISSPGAANASVTKNGFPPVRW